MPKSTRNAAGLNNTGKRETKKDENKKRLNANRAIRTATKHVHSENESKISTEGLGGFRVLYFKLLYLKKETFCLWRKAQACLCLLLLLLIPPSTPHPSFYSSSLLLLLIPPSTPHPSFYCTSSSFFLFCFLFFSPHPLSFDFSLLFPIFSLFVPSCTFPSSSSSSSSSSSPSGLFLFHSLRAPPGGSLPIGAQPRLFGFVAETLLLVTPLLTKAPRWRPKESSPPKRSRQKQKNTFFTEPTSQGKLQGCSLQWSFGSTRENSPSFGGPRFVGAIFGFSSCYSESVPDQRKKGRQLQLLSSWSGSSEQLWMPHPFLSNYPFQIKSKADNYNFCLHHLGAHCLWAAVAATSQVANTERLKTSVCQ